MMGAGIAYVVREGGHRVVLKDVSPGGGGARARTTPRSSSPRPSQRGKTTQEKADAILALDHADDRPGRGRAAPTWSSRPCSRTRQLKAKVFAEIEPHLAPDALLGSNTSTLPITGLAEGVTRPEDFIGLHFFSPGRQDAAAGDHQGREDQRRDALPRARHRQADRQDADRRQRLARLLHQPRHRHVRQRGQAMLGEGVPPPSIEQASSQAGYPAPVLQLPTS